MDLTQTTTKLDLLSTYKNGSYGVSLYTDGTKKRYKLDNNNSVLFPETIDVKITNHCDMGCKFCHEQSTIEGIHGNLEALKNQLKYLSGIPIELAIGGGNPLSHPFLYDFLLWCKEQNFICNLTVNHGHITRYRSLLNSLIVTSLIKGLGISYNPSLSLTSILDLQELTPHLVLHVIAGVHSFEDISQALTLLDLPTKILILGYKQFGFGENYFDSLCIEIEEKIKGLKYKLNQLLKPNCIISFDNLAIEQLQPQRLLFEPTKFYMGDDFTFSMYIDAVEKQFAPTSRSEKKLRVDWSEMDLENYWNLYHEI